MSDFERPALARLTWATNEGISLRCDGCRAIIGDDARYLAACIDVAEFELYGAFCERCGMALQDAPSASQDGQQGAPAPPQAHQDPPETIRAFVARVNARAESEMLRTGNIAGAHHRAIEAELAALSAGAGDRGGRG